MTQRRLLTGLVTLTACLLIAAPAGADDWPAYRRDAARSGYTPETLPVPLTELWSVAPPEKPVQAWPNPQSGWGELPKLDFDNAFHAVLAGDTVYFGSSVDHGIHALDAATGARRWTFFTGGPVRLAPTYATGRLYAGSDDGQVYCLDAATGRLIWSGRPFPELTRILGAGRLMSLWPVRTDVLVDNGVAYCGAGVFPARGTAVCAFDAETGKPLWRATTAPKESNVSLSPQGYLLASADQLYVLNGRTVPIRYARADGAVLGTLVRDYDVVKAKGVVSGGYGVLAGGRLFFGSQNVLHAYNPEGKHAGAQRDTRQLVVTPARVFRLSGLPLPKTGVKLGQNAVLGFDRAPGQGAAPAGPQKWRFAGDQLQTIIAAGDHVVAGGDGEVFLLDAESGKKLWSAKVDGRALGLAVANGRLVVSTDTGRLHAFGRGPRPAPVTPADASAVLASAAGLAESASALARDAGVARGYALVIGGEGARFALALARQTGLIVHVAETDPAHASAARAALHAAGVYGSRVVVDLVPAGATNGLPYPPYFANLLVFHPDAAGIAATPAQVLRHLKPSGGVLYAAGAPASVPAWSAAGAGSTVSLAGGNWTKLVRGRLPGSADWTHQYADAGNTGSSGDLLMRGRPEVLWYGEPGADKMPDRHRGNEAPLVFDGRVFAQGARVLDRTPLLMSFDAYNGVSYWEREFPGAERLDIRNDCGNLAVSADGLFVAADALCHRLDLATGAILAEYPTPGEAPGTTGGAWAYVAESGGTLVGSESTGYQFSKSVFAYDVKTGRLKWRYASPVIRNATLAVHDGKVLFAEHRGPAKAPVILTPLENAAAAAAKRRGAPAEAPKPSATPPPPPSPVRTVVALDLETGRELWRRDVDLAGCGNWGGNLALMVQDDVVLLCGVYTAYGKRSGEEPKRRAVGLSAKDGATLWTNAIGNLVRPVIVGDRFIGRPNAHYLKTGQPVMTTVGSRQQPWRIMPLGACGQMSASAYNLFYRYGVTVSMSVETGNSLMSFAGMRPGCLINVIPAAGLAVQVEASSGCTCYHALQATIVFAPQNAR